MKKFLFTILIILVIVIAISVYFFLFGSPKIGQMDISKLGDYTLKQKEVIAVIGNDQIISQQVSPTQAFSQENYDTLNILKKSSCLTEIKIGELIRNVIFYTNSQTINVVWSIEKNKIVCIFSSNIENSEIADWITYTNQENGFEIKYPGNFNKTESAPLAGLFMLLLTDPSYPRGYYLNVRPKPASLVDLNQWIQSVPGTNKITSSVYINGIEGKKVAVTAEETKGTVERYFFSIIKDNILYTLTYNYNDDNGIKVDDPEKDKTVSYFNQILFTFKFTK